MQTSPDLTDRQVRILQYMPFARNVSHSFRRTGIPMEDLHQLAYVGLINAADYYDGRRGVKFETYARHLIASEIRHFMRDLSEPIRRPRRLYELDSLVSRTIRDLTQKLGRMPKMAEIARAASITPHEVYEVLQTRENLRLYSLDEEREGEDGAPMFGHDHVPLVNWPSQRPDRRAELGDLLSQLPEQTARIFFLYYWCDLVQTKIAAREGISQKHVSRLLRTGALHLRAMMAVHN